MPKVDNQEIEYKNSNMLAIKQIDKQQIAKTKKNLRENKAALIW